jgi:actinin alpha
MAEEPKKRNEKGIMDKGWEQVQIKTFTKWCNNHLVKKHGSEAAITNLPNDFETGIKLMQLLNALYGNALPKYNKAPKMRPHKLDNIELAFQMLNSAGVKTHFLKPVHLVDCDQTMILGMIWAIILDFAIKGISVEELTAKEGLLLWCQKKTHGYKDVKVDNFTLSWQDGLAFCALIHKHRPDLLDFDKLSKSNPRENLELAFDVAEKHLGITRLLDVEDLVDVARPDERSVITYVSEYFHCFAAQDQYEVAARRIAKAAALAKANDDLKNDYLSKAQHLVEWINENIQNLKDREYDNSLSGVEKKLEEFKQYSKGVKPQKTDEKLEVEALFNNLQAKLRVNNRPPFVPPTECSLKAIDDSWNGMAKDETDRLIWLRSELERQQRIEYLASRFWRKAAALNRWGDENKQLVSSSDLGNSVAAVEAKLKNHEGWVSSYNNSKNRLGATLTLGQELINIGYHKGDQVEAKIAELNNVWEELKQLGDDRKEALLAELKRQQEQEEVRLEFASKSRDFVSWIEDAEDSLSEPVKTTSIAAITELRQLFQSFQADNAEKQNEYNDLVALADRMAAEGITENIYATYTIEAVNQRWSHLQSEATEREQALETEFQRQTDNEEVCKAFAEKAKSFSEWAAQQRDDITKGSEGTIEEQLDVLKSKGVSIHNNKNLLDEVITLNQQIDDRKITTNSYTEETIENLQLTWNKLGDLIEKQRIVLEKELLAQTGSKVSDEQLHEFQTTFKQFDKDGSGSLEKHEFKACLQALGQSITDESLDKLMTSICKSTPGKILFQEFVDYMISKTEDSDTPSTIKAAFKAIARDADYVTEQQLKQYLDGETAGYLASAMPPHAHGGYDYNAYVEKVYKV